MSPFEAAAAILLRLTAACLLLAALGWAEEAAAPVDAEPEQLFSIEGRLYPPDPRPADWFWQTKVLVDGGKRVAFLREDSTFAVHGLPSGSYLLEFANPDFFYEPTRIDINSKGKIRARRVNNVQPSQVTQIGYPLKLRSQGRYKYFQKREEWKITDMLMNPMILMMLLPLLLITILPKMMNDPETKREMEQMQANMNVQNQVPEISELMANFFGGGEKPKKQKSKPVRSSR